MIPYVASVSEDIRRVCRKVDTKVILKFGWTLCLMLTKVKDTMPLKKQSNVLYKILRSCKKVYIGETKRRLETRIKEHQHACGKSLMGRSEISRARMEKPPPHQMGGVSVVDQAWRPKDLLLKEALCPVDPF